MNKTITFELGQDREKIEIHGNAIGIRSLIEKLEKVLRTKDHEHLLSNEWGGDALSSIKIVQENSLIHHVKIVFLEEK